MQLNVWVTLRIPRVKRSAALRHPMHRYDRRLR